MAANDTGLPPDTIDNIHIHTEHVQGLLHALLLLGMELEPLRRPGHDSRAFYALLDAAEAECAAIARAAGALVKHHKGARS